MRYWEVAVSGFERHSPGREARRVLPGRGRRPDEEHRQDMLRRYLGAVAAVSAEQAGEQPPRPAEPPPRRQDRRAPVAPQVRDVMSVPAVCVPGDTPFLEIVRTLSGVSGKTDGSLIPTLLESIEEIDDVVKVSDHLTAI
jgi:CBS-domain-containing membrane protein